MPFTWLRVQRSASETARVVLAPQLLARARRRHAALIRSRGARWQVSLIAAAAGGLDIAGRVISPRRRADGDVKSLQGQQLH